METACHALPDTHGAHETSVLRTVVGARLSFHDPPSKHIDGEHSISEPSTGHAHVGEGSPSDHRPNVWCARPRTRHNAYRCTRPSLPCQVRASTRRPTPSLESRSYGVPRVLLTQTFDFLQARPPPPGRRRTLSRRPRCAAPPRRLHGDAQAHRHGNDCLYLRRIRRPRLTQQTHHALP